MNKEQFLKELNKKLKYLATKTRKEELQKYQDLANYDLNPVNEANKIYQEHGLNITVKENGSFLNSISIIIDTFNSKNSKAIKDLILFFLYLIFLLIIIKIPFIYVRDIISSFFPNEKFRQIWYLSIELLYAIATIITFIKLIKNKASDLEKND